MYLLIYYVDFDPLISLVDGNDECQKLKQKRKYKWLLQSCVYLLSKISRRRKQSHIVCVIQFEIQKTNTIKTCFEEPGVDSTTSV